MNLLDNFEPRDKQTPCRIRTVLSKLSVADQTVLNQALNNKDWTANALATELTRRGVKIGRESVSRHRNGECSCLRT